MSKKYDIEDNYISVIVYLHNNSRELEEFLEIIISTLDRNFRAWEIIFVNDDSIDGSEELIRNYFTTIPTYTVSIINMSYYQGYELSMSAGVELAIGDYIFEFDSPYVSYSKELIMKVYKKCIDGYDIVSASPKEYLHKLSEFYYIGFSRFSNLQYRMRTEAFRIVSRRAVNRTYSMTSQIPYRKAAYASCGLPMERIEFDISRRYPRPSAKERAEQRRVGIDALMLYTDIAYKLGIGLSFLMIIFGIVCVVYIIVVYLFGRPVPGYVSTFAISAFGFFGVNILLSILIKYASLILCIVFHKKKYLVKSIERL